MDAAATQVDAAVQAVLLALNCSASPQARQSASAFLDSLKAGEVHLVAATAFALSSQNQPSEVRHYGLKMLQHLIRSRWEDFHPGERQEMARAVIEWIGEVAQPSVLWVLKSQSAALVAEVARRGGPEMWKEMLSSLFTMSCRGPVHAELVAMVLRWLPEDVTVYNEDLDGERRKDLLKGLTQYLSEVLPFLYKLLDNHFSAAIALVQQNQPDLARQHAASVTACLNAAISYSEWAPIMDLAKSGLIEACGFLLGAAEFRLNACEFLKHLASRRRPSDESSTDSDSVMIRVFEALHHTSKDILERSVDLGAYKNTQLDAEVDFMECLCEAMAAIGSQHLVCLMGDERKLSAYLAQMLGFMQHKVLSVHMQALPFWLALFRDCSAPATGTGGSDHPTPSPSGSASNNVFAAQGGEKNLKLSPLLIPEECCSVLLDISFQRLMKKAPDKFPVEEISTEEFANRSDYGQYRGRLIELVRLVAVQRPLLSITKMGQLMDTVVSRLNSNSVSAKDSAVLEGSQVMLETVLSSIPEATLKSSAQQAVIIEGFLQQLLLVHPTDSALLELLGRYFVALGPYLKYFPASTHFVIQKLFAVLMSLPFSHGESTSVRDNARARLQVCTSILRFAKSAESSLLPHMQAFAETMTRFRQQGLLHRSELNLLGETLLVAGSAAGHTQEKEVLEWLLGPLKESWILPEWQLRYLASPVSLVGLLRLDNQMESSKGEAEMWSIFHSVTFFERSLRSCTKSVLQREKDTSGSYTRHPMVSHLQWMLPPLLQLLRCVHALWAQETETGPFIHIRDALTMGAAEQAAFVGEPGVRSSFGTSPADVNDMEDSSVTEGKSNEIRNWLKGIRDSGYNILGLAAARLGDDFFDDADGRAAALASALVENLQAMDFHHIRQLLHTVVTPLVKACPTSQRHLWLGPILPAMFVHCHQLLSVSWCNLGQKGVAKVPGKWVGKGLLSANDGSVKDMKMEVMAEKLLRDLSREVCGLLALIASPPLNQGQCSAEQASQNSGMDVVSSQPAILDGLLWFVVKLGEPVAAAALGIGIEALDWPDHDSVCKAATFCTQVVTLAVLTGDLQLQDVVSKKLFTAAICGLARESNASAQANLISLLRDVLFHFSGRTSAPWQVLSSLPSCTPKALSALENALNSTTSVKEQRSAIKTFLLTAGGDNLKALKTQRSTTMITNLSARAGLHQPRRNPSHEEPDALGLASMV